MRANEEWEISLPQLSFDIFTIVPVVNGFAPIGLVDMFNSGGALIAGMWINKNEGGFYIQGSGRFVAWSNSRPQQIMMNDEPAQFQYSERNHWLEVQVKPGEMMLFY